MEEQIPKAVLQDCLELRELVFTLGEQLVSLDEKVVTVISKLVEQKTLISTRRQLSETCDVGLGMQAALERLEEKSVRDKKRDAYFEAH